MIHNSKSALSLAREEWIAQCAAQPILKTKSVFAALSFIGLMLFQGSDDFLIGTLGLLFAIAFFVVAAWISLTVSKGSPDLWPKQFRDIQSFRCGFFNLENYPNIHPNSYGVRGFYWCANYFKVLIRRS